MHPRQTRIKWLASLFLLVTSSLSAQITICTQPPSGLVGWWPGDGNANNLIDTNDNGTLMGGATATGVGLDGQAFSFDGVSAFVQIPDAPELKPANLTIETWVRFSSLDTSGSGPPAGDEYIVFKQNSHNFDFEGYDLSKTRVSSGDVFRFLMTAQGFQSVELHSVTLLTTGVWYHVAAVRGSNFAQIYVNGQLEVQTNVTYALDYGTEPLYFGTTGQSFWDRKLGGLLDEVSIYNRALTADEIASIYASGTTGKCKHPFAPIITNQPQSLSVDLGSNALFTATAAGTPPLGYQWLFGNATIAGATNTSLALANVQLANSGAYTVVVTNAVGSTTSSVATLTVLGAPVITTQPQNTTNDIGTT
ncbi:MAG TPA: LamG-like jellyroll fold domain-containing protein, partial [Verrucomicrobiae bacterium]|nr:LamG-like jellyroll fold domain-containing protein [Verrucomicrobiae bacterium]